MFGIFGGGGMFPGMNRQPNDMAAPTPNMAQAGQLMQDRKMPAKKGGGIFGGGELNINPKLAMIAQIFSSLGGQQQNPVFAAMMAQQQQKRLEDRDERGRMAEREDWLWKQQNTAPKVNDTVADFEWFSKLPPEQQDLYRKMRQGDQFVNMSLPNGQFYAGPQSGLAAALGGGQQAPRPVGKLTPITGGANPSATPPFAGKGGYVPPMSLAGGNMTSGRRTVEGNRLVGGVPGSAHISGRSADYAGANLAAILDAARKLPGIKKAFIHNAGSGKHVHTEGEGWNVPFYGKNGTRGR